tara:strand:- start:587 stop:1342 length:756 start_codon:yes stop_codon:yes gene_type:complete
MSTTALALIETAFQHLGVYQPGETVSSADAATAFTMLNGMMESLGLQTLTIPVQSREVFSLVAGQGGPSNPYTIGPGGDFNTTRPQWISGCGLVLGGNPAASTVEIPRSVYTNDMYQLIQIKDLPNAYYTGLYYNPTYAGGLGSIYLWPVPNTSVNQLTLYRLAQLANFSSLSASYDLPPGYLLMIPYNLALMMGTMWPAGVTPMLQQMAVTTLATVKRANTIMVDLPSDAPTRNRAGFYNINTGVGGGSF